MTLACVAGLGSSALGTFTFTNGAPITIPSSGPGAPYPSSILVAGLGAAIADVNVTITGLSHTWPDDIDLLLVGPTGVTTVLMSDAGGSTDVVGVTYTFSDGSPLMLDAAVNPSGTYGPTNFAGAADIWPAPAPVGPYGAALSGYNGLSGNGTWSLFVADNAAGDVGSIAGGWSLTIKLVPAPGALAMIALAGLIRPRRRR
jgi:subtilisin-like proprotein convertase family protein